MSEYTSSLVSDLQRPHRSTENGIRLTLNIEEILLGINEAIPCGLIINELVSNALKHAFPKGRTGEVPIRRRPGNNSYRLLTKDNGLGFPEHVDYRNSPSLGLTLINSLVEQLEGTIELDTTDGHSLYGQVRIGEKITRPWKSSILLKGNEHSRSPQKRAALLEFRHEQEY